MSDLPDGWEWTTLGEVADTTLGKMLDRGKSAGHSLVPYLRNLNVQWGRFDLSDISTMDIPTDQRSRFELKQGDLLICEGGEIGRSAVWPGSNEYIAFQKALHRVRPHRGIDANYLRYLMEYLRNAKLLDPFTTGSTIKHLPQEQLRRLPVPLASEREQLRVVAILEDILSRVDAATHFAQSAQARIDNLQTSLLESALHQVEFDRFQLDNLLKEPLINGRSVPTQQDGFPVLRLTSLQGSFVNLRERKNGAWTKAEASPFLVKLGDFMISRGNGSLKLVGRGGLVVDEPDDVAFPDTLIRARPDSDRLDPHFLAIIWNSPYVRIQLESAARTTAGIYKINQSILRKIELPVPSIREQQRIVAKIADSTTFVTKTSRAIRDAVMRGKSLRRSLLAEAFAGRLTSQTFGDEGASVLLVRVGAGHPGSRKSDSRSSVTKRTAATSSIQETLL